MKKKSFNGIFHEILSFFLVVAIVAGTFYYSPKPVEAATYTFTQNGWIGGATANTASHTSDQTGWAQFSTSTSGLSAGSTITLATSTYYFTDDGTVSTSGSATGGGFSNGTNSSTTVSGSGSGASVGLTQISQPTSTIDSAGDTGWSPHIAVDSSGGRHIIYYDYTDNSVNYAKTNASGEWSVSTIFVGSNRDTDGDHNIAVDSNGYVHTVISNGYTRYATNAPSGTWSETIIDSSSNYYGSSIGIDSNGKIHIAFPRYNGGVNGGVYYATNASGSWATSTVDISTTEMKNVSLAIDSNNKIHLAYYNKANGYLRYATNTSGSWNASTLDPSNSTYHPSIAIDSNDKIHISYGNTAVNRLYYITNASGSWATSTIDTQNSYSSSIAVDSNNKIHISYQGGASYPTKYATNASGAWVLTTLDAPTNGYTSIDLDSNNKYHIAYYDTNTNNLDLKYATNVLYPSSGVFTSAVIDLAASSEFTVLNYASSSQSNTAISIKVRSDSNSNMSGASAWGSCSAIASGAGLSSGGCVTNGHRYVQYQAVLSTSNTSVTPSLNSATINYAQYPASAALTSSKYDTSSDSNLISKINWTASATSTTETVRFQIRSASSSAGLDSAAWCGYGDCSGSTYFTDANNNQALASGHSLRSGGDDRWFQYRVLMGSGGSAAPVLSQVVVTYVVNASPDFNSSYGTGGVSASQVSDGSADYDNDASVDQGKVLLIYSARDQDSLSGSTNPGQISPSFEYRLTSTSSWTSISSGYLNTGALSLKSVSETNYTSTSTAVTATTTSALWNASAQLGTNVYLTTVQLRVTANDNEGANNTAVATSSAFTLDTKPPTAAITIDSSASSDAITYNFSDDSNIEYRISNNGGFSNDGNGKYNWQTVGATSTTASTTWTLAGSPSYETVYFQVRDIYGNATASSSDTAPLTPTNFYYKDISNPNTGDYREFLSWGLYVAASSSADFGSTRVYRSTDGLSYSQIASITDSAQNYYTNSGLSSSTTYYYKVLHIDSDGDISNFTSAVSDKPDGQGGTDSTAPIISSVATSTVRSVSAVITWTTDEAASSTVQYSTAAAGDYASSATVVSYVTSHSVTVSGLIPNTAYVFRVRSMDISGNEATATNGGAGYSFTTQGGPIVSGVSCPEVSDNSLTIIWNTNTDSNSEIEYSVNSSLSSSNSSSSAALVGSSALAGGYYQHRIVLSGLSQSTTYYYQVKSTDGSSNQTIDNNSGVYYTCKTTADAKPPVISNIQTPVRTANAVVITWDTDEPATTRVVYDATSRVSAPDSYSNSTTQDNTLTRIHVATVSGLTAQTTYYYRVRSSDANSNAASSTEQSVDTASERDIVTVYVVSGGGGGDSSKKDETAPTISGIEVADIGAFEAMVKFMTDESAIAVLEYGETNSYGFVGATRDYGTSHSVKLTGLKMGADYHFKIKAIDKSANYSNSSDETFKTKYFAEIVKDLKELADLENLYSFQKAIEQSIESVAPSIIPPFIEEPKVSDITENSAVVRWKTNIKAYPLVSYATEEEYDIKKTNSYAAEVSDLGNKSDNHEINLTGLLPNTKYHFMVKSYVLPQAVGKSDDMTFVTKAPKIKPRVADIDKDAIRIVWTTAELSSSIVEYKNLRTGEINRKTREEMIVEHDIKIENLNPDTSYEIKAMGYNEKGNLVETGEPIVARTSKDIFPPVISNLKIDGALVPGRTDRVQMVVSWKTDEPATSVVEYEEGSGSADDELSARIADTDTFVQNHTIIITTLKPGSLYRVKVNSVDDAGNKAVLPVRTIITPRQAESIIDIVVKNFEDTFQFLKKIR